MGMIDEDQQRPVRVALVGAGGMANAHAAAFTDVPGAELVGVHSRTRSRAEVMAQSMGITAVHDSVEDLIEETTPNLVVVTVFETSMLDVALSVLEHDVHVLLEKPPGIHAPAAREILAAADARGRTVQVGLNRRHLSSTRQAIAFLDDDDAPRHIHVQDQQSLDEARAHGHPEVVVENWMYANSIHLVDYIRLLGRGQVVSVERLSPWPVRPPGIVLARVTFDSGDVAVYEGIWDGPGPWAVAVTTRSQRLEMRPLETGTRQLRGERTRVAFDISDVDTRFKPGLREQAQQVVNAVRGLSSTAVGLREAVESMTLVETIFARE